MSMHRGNKDDSSILLAQGALEGGAQIEHQFSKAVKKRFWVIIITILTHCFVGGCFASTVCIVLLLVSAVIFVLRRDVGLGSVIDGINCQQVCMCLPCVITAVVFFCYITWTTGQLMER